MEDTNNVGTSGEKSGDGDREREEPSEEMGGEDDGGTNEEELDGGSKDDGNVGANKPKRAKNSTYGRNVQKALKVQPAKHRTRVSKWVSPFRADIWKQDTVDGKLELQLWDKIIKNEEYARYILYL